ncbi:MAG: M20 family peptidase [Bacteroidota bacterium]
MKKLFRLLLRLSLLVLVVVLGTLLFNTLNYSSHQVAYAPIEKIQISDQVIERLAASIRIPTVSYETHVDTAAMLDLHRLLDSQFVLIDSLLEKEVVNEFSLIYHWPGKNQNLQPILLIAHLDVVPVEEESKKAWAVPPYSGVVKDGFIWGRGTLDDKVSVMGLLEAVELLLQNNYQPERSIYLAFGHDEEVSGRNGAEAIARRFKQQNIHFEYVLDEGSVILEKALPGLEQPLAMIGHAEKGNATLTLTARLPEGGHSSMPPKESSIGILSKALLQLEENPIPAKIEGTVKTMFDHVGPETNWPYKIIFANLWLFDGILINQLSAQPAGNAILRTTTAPTILQAGVKNNVLPTEAKAKINFRILPGETPETVATYIRQTINDERVEVSNEHAHSAQAPSKVSGISSFGYHVIQRSIREVFPATTIAPSLVIAATDSRHYSEVVDNTYRFLPLQISNKDLKRIHGIDERIRLTAYKQAIQFYYQLLINSSQ